MSGFTPNPTAIAALVEAQEGAVVSRVILRNGGCTLTVFAFGKGEGLSEHATPHEAVLLLLEGALSITLGEETHQMSTGDILNIPPSVSHTLHSGQAFKMLLILTKDSG